MYLSERSCANTTLDGGPIALSRHCWLAKLGYTNLDNFHLRLQSLFALGGYFVQLLDCPLGHTFCLLSRDISRKLKMYYCVWQSQSGACDLSVVWMRSVSLIGGYSMTDSSLIIVKQLEYHSVLGKHPLLGKVSMYRISRGEYIQTYAIYLPGKCPCRPKKWLMLEHEWALTQKTTVR